MQLIVGLGNPGAKYNFTRHNFGFLALDFYAKLHALTWQKPQFHAAWLQTDGKIFIKPQDYYNLSGRAVQEFAHFYKISPENILVICDDFDLPFGETRYRARGSSGGSHGLDSIINALGTTDFPRLRLGTNNIALREKLSDVDFVLSHFTTEEKALLPAILQAGLAKVGLAQ